MPLDGIVHQFRALAVIAPALHDNEVVLVSHQFESSHECIRVRKWLKLVEFRFREIQFASWVALHILLHPRDKLGIIQLLEVGAGLFLPFLS